MQIASAASLLWTLSAITANAEYKSPQAHIAAQQVFSEPQVKILVSAVQQEIPGLGIMYAGYQGTLDSDSVGELLQHSQ